MNCLIEAAESLGSDEMLPVGIMAGPGIIHGLIVSESRYVRLSRESLKESSHGGGFFSGNDGSTFRHSLELFNSKELWGVPARGEIPLVHCFIAMGMMSTEVPAMRLSARQVISWWITESKSEGTKFQGGGVGVGF